MLIYGQKILIRITPMACTLPCFLPERNVSLQSLSLSRFLWKYAALLRSRAWPCLFILLIEQSMAVGYQKGTESRRQMERLRLGMRGCNGLDSVTFGCTLGLPWWLRVSCSSSSLSLDRMWVLMASSVRSIQLCWRRICLCSSCHWWDIIWSMSRSPVSTHKEIL